MSDEPLHTTVETDDRTYQVHYSPETGRYAYTAVNRGGPIEQPIRRENLTKEELPDEIKGATFARVDETELLRKYSLLSLVDKVKAPGYSLRQIEEYYKDGLRLLLNAPNDVLALAHEILDTYHDGEATLKTLSLRSHFRAHYNSTASLIHLDITGLSRGGKDKFTSRLLALLPGSSFRQYSTVSSKSFYYATMIKDRDAQGKIIGQHQDPNHYAETVIVVSEIADAGGYTALKAAAEEDQYSTRVHLTVSPSGDSAEYSLQGPRQVIVLSVRGIAETDTNEIKNRFLQAPIETRDDDSTLARNKQLLVNLKRGTDVRDDPRTPIVTAALDILYHNGLNVVFEAPTDEACKLLDALVALFTKTGFNATQIGQFYSLCECAAFQKRYFRGSPATCRIEVDDVLESWFLVKHFAKETVTKVAPAFLKVLDQIELLSEEELSVLGYDNFAELKEFDRAPTQADLVRRGLSKGTVSKALKADGGVLIDADLVYNEYNDLRNTTVYRRTNNSVDIDTRILSLNSVKVEEKRLEPTDPVVSKVSIGFQKEWKLKEAQDVENGDVRGFYRELVYEFPSFQEYKLPGNPTAASSSTSMRIPGNVETSKPENEKTQGEVETTNKPQKELGNVAETMETSRKPVETSVSPVPDIDQATIAQDIREILTEAKKAGLIVNDAQQLAQAVAIKVKQRHKGTTMLIANIEHDFYKLAENDHIIQGLIADITGGK